MRRSKDRVEIGLRGKRIGEFPLGSVICCLGDKGDFVQGFTAKAFPLDVPTEVVTITGPVEAPAGTMHLMAVFDHEV